MDELQLMVVLVPWRLREDIVDVLMPLEEITGFNALEAEGFSREHSHFNLAEQVAGSRRFCRFEILHAPRDRQRILDTLAPQVGFEHVRYWVVDLVAAGRLGTHT
jgi:hypothetical protein